MIQKNPAGFPDLFVGPTDAVAQAETRSDDVFSKFFEDAQLATHLGGGQLGQRRAEAVRTEIAKLDSPFRAALAKRKTPATPKAIPTPAPAPDELKKMLRGGTALTERLTRLFDEFRPHCVGDEEGLLKSAVACLDMAAFAEIGEKIMARVKARA